MNDETLKTSIAEESLRINKLIETDLAEAGDPVLRDLLEYSLFAGGKRIRPLLVFLSARLVADTPGQAGKKADSQAVAQLAIAFEYLHAASLIHDDIIDSSSLRRGRETAHLRWGKGPAILAGDFLHARALLLAGLAGGEQCLRLIGAATQAMVVSEFIQMRVAAEQDWRQESYFAVLAGKTAALIAAACECGALAAGASSAQAKALYRYGNNLGLAFQIVDDILDFTGDPAASGKAKGNDLQEGKMTLPILLAGKLAGQEKQARLKGIMQLPADERAGHLPEVIDLLAESGALKACSKEASGLIAEAIAGLSNCGFASDDKNLLLLAALGNYVLKRDR